MDLAGILKLASLANIDLGTVEELAKQGLGVARQFVMDHFHKTWMDAIPGILKNLETKAPLDGQQRKDKDGIVMTDVAYFIHESDYLLWKAVIHHGGLLIDGFRDSHISKMWTAVNAHAGETRETILGRLVESEMELTF